MSVPATSPKKKSLMPSGELRRRLRGLAHKLSAVVQIGKEGVSDGVLRQVTGALFDHELIKVKIGGEGPDDRFAVAERLGQLPGVNVVQILGRVVVIYKRHPEKPRYEGAASKARAADKPTPAPSPEAGREKKREPGREKKREAGRDKKREPARDKRREPGRDKTREPSRARGPRRAPGPRAARSGGAPRGGGRPRARS
jgi:RNA-binding protein